LNSGLPFAAWRSQGAARAPSRKRQNNASNGSYDINGIQYDSALSVSKNRAGAELMARKNESAMKKQRLPFQLGEKPIRMAEPAQPELLRQHRGSPWD
jgi:hypothetical protein